MSLFDDDRRHAATPARRERARKDGDHAYSHELATAIQLIAAVAAIWFLAASIGTQLQQLTRMLWDQPDPGATHGDMVLLSQRLVWKTVGLVLPFLLSVFVVGTLAHLVQMRMRVKFPRCSINRLTGVSWMRNLFSMSHMGTVLMALPRATVAIGAGATTIWLQRHNFYSLGALPADQFARVLLQLVATAGITVALSLLACAAIDYGMKFLAFQQRLRMTDQELREELRGQTADPQIARVQNQRMRELPYGGRHDSGWFRESE